MTPLTKELARLHTIRSDQNNGKFHDVVSALEVAVEALDEARHDQTQLTKNYSWGESMARESWMYEAHERIDRALDEITKLIVGETNNNNQKENV